MKLTLPAMSTFLNLAGEDIVKINVGGAIYEAPFGIFENLPHTRLGKIHSAASMEKIEELCDGYNEDDREFFFDHTCPYFRGILGCYYNEKLHLEETTCVFDFKQTLSYWGLSEANMDSYCGHRCAEKKFQAMRDIKNHNKVVNKFAEEDFGICDWGEFRQTVWVALERPTYTKQGQIYQLLMISVTCLSLVSLCDAVLPSKHVNTVIFKSIDAVTVFLFSLDYVIRFCIAGDKMNFLGSGLNCVDMLSIIPYLFVATLIRLTLHYTRFNAVIRSQPVYFTLRVLRILRIVRYSYSLQNLIQTLKRSSRQLVSLLLLSAIATIFFAGIAYYAERNVPETPFISIPESMWWSVVTITSVGYGDYTPVTIGGRFIGVLCIFFSLVFVGLPISIVTQSFTQTHSDELLKDIVQGEVISYNMSKKHKHFDCVVMRCCIEYCLQIVEDHLLLNELEIKKDKNLRNIWNEDSDDDLDIMPSTTSIPRPSELPHTFPRRVILNVGGTKFEILRYSMKYAPDSRFALIYEAISPRQVMKYCDSYNEVTGEIMFYRSPKFFDSIMRYYQTGKLHLTHCCVVGFREELDYWGIEEMSLEPCCRMKYFFHKYEMQQCQEQKEIVRERIAKQNRLWTRKRYILWAILESPQHHWAGLVYTVIYTMVILMDTTVVIMNSIPYFNKGHPIETGHPKLTAIEHACVNLFIADFSIRFCAAPSSHKFFSSKLNIIELSAMAPSLVLMILQQSYIPAEGSATGRFMIFLLALRVARVFKIARYSSSLRSLTHTLFSGLRDICILIIILFMTAIFFSNIMFYAEKSVSSIHKEMPFPDAVWWAIVTMTTVGYGDVVPITTPGKIVGGFCVLASLVLISVPVSLIIVNFTRHYILTNLKRKVIKLEIVQEDFERRQRPTAASLDLDYVTRREMMQQGYKGLSNRKLKQTAIRKRKLSKDFSKGKKPYTGKESLKSNRKSRLESHVVSKSRESHTLKNDDNSHRRNKWQISTIPSSHRSTTKPNVIEEIRDSQSFLNTNEAVCINDLWKQERSLSGKELSCNKEKVVPFYRYPRSYTSTNIKAASHLQDSSNTTSCSLEVAVGRGGAQRSPYNIRSTQHESVDYKSTSNLKQYRSTVGRLRRFRNPLFNTNRSKPEKYRVGYLHLTPATESINVISSKSDSEIFNPVHMV